VIAGVYAKTKGLPQTTGLKHHNPPFGTKKQSSSPVFLLMNSTGKWSGVSSSLNPRVVMVKSGKMAYWDRIAEPAENSAYLCLETDVF